MGFTKMVDVCQVLVKTSSCKTNECKVSSLHASGVCINNRKRSVFRKALVSKLVFSYFPNVWETADFKKMDLS